LYLIGLIAGDGYVEERRVTITTSNILFALRLMVLIHQKLKTNPKIFFDLTSNVWRIRITTPQLLQTLKTFGIPTGKKFDKVNLDFSERLSTKEKAELIAGWFDAEGWFELDKGSPRIRIKIKNLKVIKQLSWLINEVTGIIPRMFSTGDCFGLTIQGKSKVKTFLKLILLIHPKWDKLRAILHGGSPESPGLHAMHNARHNGMRP